VFPETWQLALALLGALLIGLAKTGVPGLGILVSALFANLLPAKEASGFVLPMLIFGDMVAVATYRRQADWKQALRLLPWTVPGVLLGALTLGRIDDGQARLLVGVVIAAMTLWHVARKWIRSGPASPEAHGPWAVALLGMAAGYTTLIANAAGPIMTLYLLAIGLPKLEFVGTAAVFFCVLNLFKVPFMAGLGLLTTQSFLWNLCLAPVVWGGAWAGRWVLHKIPQRAFEWTALVLSALAALKLLLF
jgi:uncharacterized membrane protein YfcA